MNDPLINESFLQAGLNEAAVAANAFAAHPRAWRNRRSQDRWFSGQPVVHSPGMRSRFEGGERGCTGEQFENVTPGNGHYWPAGAAFLCSTKACA